MAATPHDLGPKEVEPAANGRRPLDKYDMHEHLDIRNASLIRRVYVFVSARLRVRECVCVCVSVCMCVCVCVRVV